MLAEECPNTTDIRTSSQPKGSRHPDAQTRTQLTQLGPPHIHGEAEQRHETKVDTEAGMLSGVSRKRSIRSNPCWFTEFCKSQCLSHFAAPFIVARAETSVAESCKEAITVWWLPPTGNTSTTRKMSVDSWRWEALVYPQATNTTTAPEQSQGGKQESASKGEFTIEVHKGYCCGHTMCE